MKNNLLIVFILMVSTKSFSQSFSFEHTGSRAEIISKEKLDKTKLLSDLIHDKRLQYSRVDYMAVETKAVCNGKALLALSTNDTLTAEQKNMINSADRGTDIFIKVKFQFKSNPNKPEELEFVFTPGPEIEAAYPGGNEQLLAYLKETIFSKINETITIEKISRVSVAFIVNENGEIGSSKIYRTSGDAETDQLILDAVGHMPNWSPAQYTKGVAVKQPFILNVNSGSFSSQNSRNRYLERQLRLVKKEKLSAVNFMSDILYDYPKQYYSTIIDYVQVDIMATCNGKTISAQSASDTLNAEQKNILALTDAGTDLNIKIRFKYKDSANDNIGSGRKIKEMAFIATVIPEIEAEYPGGADKLAAYLNEHVVNHIPLTSIVEKTARSVVTFVIDEEGEVSEAKLVRTGTDPKTDELLLEAIKKMPKWKPAVNSQGEKVKQTFKLALPFTGGC